MPEQTTIKYPLGDIADILDKPRPRTKGWHITDLQKAADYISRGKDVPNGGWGDIEDTQGLMALGRIWEASVRKWIDQRLALPMGLHLASSREIPLDGILATPDGEIKHMGTTVAVVEMKATTTRSHSPGDKLNWLGQVKAYCHMLNVTQVWFVVLHMPRNAAPEASVYWHILNFKKQEIDENWKMLSGTRDYLENKGIRLWQ